MNPANFIRFAIIFSVAICVALRSLAQNADPVRVFDSGNISNNQAFGISFSHSGDTAFFVRSYGGRTRLSIMQSIRVKGQWQVPVPAFFSTPGIREIDPMVSPDGNTILFNSRKDTGKQLEKDLDIWMIRRSNGHWGSPIPVHEVNTAEQETYATITSNRNLYFNVNKPGGFGGTDIYVSKWKNGKYQSPVNIGFPINTQQDESNCFIAADESYMIFSANGYTANFGGHDLYISFKIGEQWSTPMNLGNQINSPYNDFCPFITKDSTLYFSRSQKEGDLLVENIFYTRLNLSLLHSMAKLKEENVFANAFPEGNVYGITFSHKGNTAFTTLSNATRSFCEIWMVQKNASGVWTKSQRMSDWHITKNVSNPVISHDQSFALLRISEIDTVPDLYISRKEKNGQWTTPIALPAYINSPIDEYYPELTDSNHLYYSSKGDLYHARFKDGEWQAPHPVSSLNTSYAESNAAVSRSGRFLVFMSNRPGGYGTFDLYISKKGLHGWENPINLGSTINTNAMEYQPRFSTDDQDLYFTRSVFSNGTRQGKEQVLKVSVKELLSHIK